MTASGSAGSSLGDTPLRAAGRAGLRASGLWRCPGDLICRPAILFTCEAESWDHTRDSKFLAIRLVPSQQFLLNLRLNLRRVDIAADLFEEQPADNLPLLGR